MMFLPLEIATCLVAIAAAARLATVEFARVRKQRQMSQALVRAFNL